ncbi:MAG: type II secretion system minor pseudopilin GspK [Gammaproteobacteria bacterium]|nr:type II secretion system minor pseudopilin GspK [Gammaproteobacteria bacterium]
MSRLGFHQGGVALVSVLLIVAILMAIASRLLASHHLVINQNQNTFEQNQALQYALGAEALAQQALIEDLTVSNDKSDHLEELWAKPIMPFELDEGGFLEAQLTDLNGCFNLNTVAGSDDEVAMARFKTLAQLLGVQPQIAEMWKDWIDEDNEITGFGAEDREYLIAQPPHRTPNQLVTHLSELALLSGIGKDQLSTLSPLICLLPDADSLLNVNTANSHALAALDPGLSLAITEPIVAVPRNYASVQEFIDANPDFTAVAAALSVSSDYFLLHAQAQVGSSTVTLQSMLHRNPSNGQVKILSRDLGKLFRSNLSINTEEA